MRLVAEGRKQVDLVQGCFERLPSILWSVPCGVGSLILPPLLPWVLTTPETSAPHFSTCFLEVVSTGG